MQHLEVEMKRTFFLMLVLVIWFTPSLAGCASGGQAQTHLRPANNDAGPDVRRDAGAPVLPRDAGVSVGMDASPDETRDAGHYAGVPDASTAVVSSHDAGPSTPDAYTSPVPDSGEEHLLRIALSSSVRAQCPAGWRIRLWLTDPPVESTRGLDLELHIPVLTRWGPWSSITLWCDERMPQWYVWDATDRSSAASGAFSELSLDGVDLRTSTMICEDPLAPDSGFRPILMWDPARRVTCPP
jgi:hypothetical protein